MKKTISIVFSVVCVMFLFAVGCNAKDKASDSKVKYDVYADVLATYVDKDGFVDYEGTEEKPI